MASKTKVIISFFFLVVYLSVHQTARSQHEFSTSNALSNPIDTEYLRKHMVKTHPRLVLNPEIEESLRASLKSDPVVQNLYAAIKINADNILKRPLLERKMDGRRLLNVSREMLYRMNMLGMVYRMEKNPIILARIKDEITTVCSFEDWNPSHFLDVAEMAMAVAIGVDWAGGDLPDETMAMAKNTLIAKGIEPSFNGKHSKWWLGSGNNWNQVCNGGLVAAALVTADTNPELASRTIARALDSIPEALIKYLPDGVYPEGSTYWSYGTSFTVATIAMLESALGNDFGISDFPGFIESAGFRVRSIAPSGAYFNFGDCSDRRDKNGDVTLAWFAKKTGNRAFFERERFLAPPSKMGKLERNAGMGLVWVSQFEENSMVEVPMNWKGDGENPVLVFASSKDDPYRYYLGAKGGLGKVGHGNMDAGSFVFELDGVRWSVDPGNQNYNALEQSGFKLWKDCQTCQRWTLLTKNNFGHSTLTVNDSLHNVDGKAVVSHFKGGEHPEAIINLDDTFEGQLKSAKRKFIKESPSSLLIEDRIVPNDATQIVTWQMMTLADVEVMDEGAMLRQDGKILQLENLSHPDVPIAVVPLDPPPLELDKKIKNLKRIEIRIPRDSFEDEEIVVSVRLSL